MDFRSNADRMPELVEGACPCCAGAMSLISWPSDIPLVFSDCSKWQGPNPELGQCQCGYLRKITSRSYLDSIDSGYANYLPYHQGKGVEQAVSGFIMQQP